MQLQGFRVPMQLTRSSIETGKGPQEWFTGDVYIGHRARGAVHHYWYSSGIRATIDKAGRLVIPKQLRDHVGLRAGEVEVTVEGTGLRVEPLATDSLAERDGRLLIPSAGTQIDDDLVRSLRDAGQR
jgi:AbrB family looped-hinge helix DNA binding protein